MHHNATKPMPMWEDILLLIICAFSSLIIPYIIYARIKKIKFNPEKETLSFLSNTSLFGKKMSEGYTEVLFVTAILSFAFFLVLILKLGFIDDTSIFTWMAISLGSLVLLAFAHHNIVPFKLKNLYMNTIRIVHNILAVIVFISLPVLMVKFDLYLINDRLTPSLLGLIIIGLTIMGTILSLIKMKKLTGITEITFVTGICLWNILTALFIIF